MKYMERHNVNPLRNLLVPLAQVRNGLTPSQCLFLFCNWLITVLYLCDLHDLYVCMWMHEFVCNLWCFVVVAMELLLHLQSSLSIAALLNVTAFVSSKCLSTLHSQFQVSST